MVNIKEIRVGNWLSTYEGSWGIVNSIGRTVFLNHALGSRGYLPENLFPIVIKMDLLSLCGFQPNNAGYLHKDKFLILRYEGEGDCVIEIAKELKEFMYVHQLQNLFFEATGQLLEPNLFGN